MDDGGIIAIFCCIVLLCWGIEFYQKCTKPSQEPFENKTLKDAAENIKKKADKIERLFMDCAIYVQNQRFSNNLESTVYTLELALHIFSLWLANYKKDNDGKLDSERKKIEYALDLTYYYAAIQYYLNLLINESLHQSELNLDTVKKMINSRIALIYKENDFEERNFNFMNLCNTACKYELESVLVVHASNDMPITFGNPLLMTFLPMAYTAGLIDKYLELL